MTHELDGFSLGYFHALDLKKFALLTSRGCFKAVNGHLDMIYVQ